MAYMNDYPEFASFLHNPWAYPSKVEEAAITSARRSYRFIGGTDIDKDVTDILHKFFGDVEQLHKFGLVKYYKAMEDYVKENHLIGHILYATNIDDEKDVLINKYQTNTGSVINLTVKSITTRLIKEYIKRENVEALCRKIPNFDIYYSAQPKKSTESRGSSR